MTQATDTLPPGYIVRGKMDLTKQPRLYFALNVLGLVILAAAGVLFVALARLLRPDAVTALFEQFSRGGGARQAALLLLGMLVVMLVIHEAIHGVFFWRFTGARPRFGIGPGYAYAAAPGWYLPRNQYLVVGLAPLVRISLGGLALIAVMPASWSGPLLALIIGNASGAVGDMAVVAWLLTLPKTALANDDGSAVTIYVPEMK
jgi:hypothetical protein